MTTLSDWDEVKAWRRAERVVLLEERRKVPQQERRALDARIADLIEQHVTVPDGAIIAFYWPFKGEVDLRPLIRRLCKRGGRAALPVVVAAKQPLEFWVWQPGMKLERGRWDIPVPATREAVQPTMLFVPLLGFDARGYRLGYGTGYYDRTLAALSPKPRAIGVGHERGRLPTIHPQPHDVRMDAIVTEAGFDWRSS